jgi:hypothetical protein
MKIRFQLCESEGMVVSTAFGFINRSIQVDYFENTGDGKKEAAVRD